MAQKKTSKKAAKKPAAKSGATKKASPAKNKAASSEKAAPKKAAAKKASPKKTPKKASSKKAPSKKAPKKAAAKKVAAAKPAEAEAPDGQSAGAPDAEESSSKRSSTSQAAADVAARVLSGDGDKTIVELGDDLISGKKSVAAQAARVLDEILEQKPEAVVPIIDRYAKAIGASDKRPAQSAANALPQMARVAPARVARHLPRLKESFDGATAPGRDGLVRTFAGLCTASVAYQKRLEEVLNKGLREADAKTLISWTEVVLPALKGEPHARARATVEQRLGRIPKVHAQKIADFLGIKLRLRYR